MSFVHECNKNNRHDIMRDEYLELKRLGKSAKTYATEKGNRWFLKKHVFNIGLTLSICFAFFLYETVNKRLCDR